MGWWLGTECVSVSVCVCVCVCNTAQYEPSEVCFENLGCFSDAIPWAGTVERPDPRLPWSPEKIGTRFLLFTQENPQHYQACGHTHTHTQTAL